MKQEHSQIRIERGGQRLAAAIRYWLAHSLSQDKLCSIVHWAYGETSGFDGGTFSRLSNGNQQRGPGIRHLDALAEANRAIWIWQTQGEAAAIKEFGLHSNHGVRPEWLNATIWLPKPGDATLPLDLGDLVRVLMGRLELPYVAPRLQAREAKVAGERLLELLNELAQERGWKPLEAVQKYLAAYPGGTRVRVARLKSVLTGESYTQPELELEMAALAEMIRQVRGIERFTPADLQAELLSADPPGPARSGKSRARS
jgi:hypothetical protein